MSQWCHYCRFHCLSVLSAKTVSCVRKHLKEAVCFVILFSCEYLRKYWSSTVNSVAVMALLLMSYYIAANKEHLTERQIIFKCRNSAFLQLYCQKFSCKFANISRSYKENKTVPFYVWIMYNYYRFFPRMIGENLSCGKNLVRVRG